MDPQKSRLFAEGFFDGLGSLESKGVLQKDPTI